MLNPRQRAVLAALVRGPVVPADLGDRLELPSAAVVGHMDSLRELGFEIDRGPDGFVLESVPDYGYGIQAELDARFVVDYQSSVPSTNDRARSLAERGETDVAVVADEQTAGRGRRDRDWASPAGGIYCTVLVRPVLDPERLPLLGLAAGVALVDAVSEIGIAAGCKWPNDLQGPDGRKLAGILSESATVGGSVDWVAIGVGMNANVDPGMLPAEATSLQALVGGPVDRRPLVQAFLASFDGWRGNPAAVLDTYRDHSSTLGEEIWVRTGDGEMVGRAVDVDETGALLLERADGSRRITAGDCEHLRPV